MGITGCVSVLEHEHELEERILAIEGFIDNGYGPHEIKVSYLSKFAGVLEGGEVRRINASVSIIDEFGITTPLARQSGTILYLNAETQAQSCSPVFGSREFITNYLTPPSFRGEPGVSYLLEIVDEQTGKTYRSSFIEMPQPIEVDSVLFEFESFQILNSRNCFL